MTGNQRGSAMILAILVVVILTMLGMSFLLMADMENRIAENELFSAQALYFGEAVARSVVQWFDHPASAQNVWAFDPTVADRTLRTIDQDGGGPLPAHLQDGSTYPRYKQGIDANGDLVDDLFERPYRKGDADTLLGTETGPDIRIDSGASTSARTFLDGMSEALLAGYPNGAAGVHARIVSIDIYAPPYLQIAGEWVRYGIGTIKVVARIERTGFGEPQTLAERVVKLVVNEIPYSLPYGALHSCGGTRVDNGVPAAWGAITETLGATLPGHTTLPASLGRAVPAQIRNDLLWGWEPANFAAFDAYRAALSGASPPVIEDPWFRVVVGQGLTGWTGSPQPSPFAWTISSTLGPGTQPNHAGGAEGSHSNLFQNMALADCPNFDYALWKSIATSGRDGVEYYTWDSGDQFRRDGTGTARSFRSITDVDPAQPGSRPKVFFFDTRDRRAPHDDDGDGRFDNLTPAIEFTGGTWSPRGVVFLNSEKLRASEITGRTATIRAPAEPFQDRDQNGAFDAGEGWINLRYPASYPSGLVPSMTAKSDDFLLDDGSNGTVPVRNTRGPAVTADVSLWGILATTGRYDASGNATHFGSIWAFEGVEQSLPAQPAARVYWDDSIGRGEFPPADWPLPRVIATRWQTDL